jgi:hypothetical protein
MACQNNDLATFDNYFKFKILPDKLDIAVLGMICRVRGADCARPTHYHKLGADGSDRVLRRFGAQIREIVL